MDDKTTEITEIDTYLARLPVAQRDALNHLRRVILDTAPEAVECIAYQVPTLKLYGLMLVSFGAAKKHCAFYPGAHAVFGNEVALADFDTSKGTIRFQPDRPIPDSIIRTMVLRRAEENRDRVSKRTSKN